MDKQRCRKVREVLIGWAVEALGRWAGIASGEYPAEVPPKTDKWLSHYGQLLSPAWHPKKGKGDQLLSIFSLVQLEGSETARPVFVSARPLSLKTILPDEEGEEAAPGELWKRFVDEFGRLPAEDGRFETFIHLFYKYAWAVPCTYGEKGVSLYEELKALAALMHASDGAEKPDGSFLLVGGDIPGIQDFVYTITSKGAAKGLRGRSFFIQLLGDAVVRRILANLELCLANVVYNAGGNFTVMGPASSEDALRKWQRDFNRILLDEFEGDLYLALAWERLPQSAVGTSEFAKVREGLGAKVAAAKSRRFAEVVEINGWAKLFQPKGRGGLDYCQICQREPRPGEKLVEETTEAGEAVRKCEQCCSFEALARDIAYDKLWMVITEADAAMQEEGGWQGTLARLTGFAYRFVNEPSQVSGLGTVCVLNSTDQGEASVHGFRFVANVTPRIEEADRRWVQEHHPDMEVPPGERIKDFALMALQSQGIPRVGVLRMDVDNLGAIFGQYLRGSMAQVSTLSAALDLFFGGYLNHICDEVGAQGEHRNVIYAIYSGGDDLFIVGSWELMPRLAERIHDDFATYVGHNPHVCISAGITLEGRKFPLYRAAERAGEALDNEAKEYKRKVNGQEREKDAICLLGQVVGWEDWKLVAEQMELLVELIKAGMPRGLLQIVQGIYSQFVRDREETHRRKRRQETWSLEDQVYYGRWMWLEAYSLSRLVSRYERRVKDVEKKIERLEQGILRPETVRYSGLAARWAEYLTRGGN